MFVRKEQRLQDLIEYGLVFKENTIADTMLGLEWRIINNEQKEVHHHHYAIDYATSLEEAEQYCKNLTIDGHNDWRLPSKEEADDFLEKMSCVYSSSTFPTKCWFWVDGDFLTVTFDGDQDEEIIKIVHRMVSDHFRKCNNGEEDAEQYDNLLESYLDTINRDNILKDYNNRALVIVVRDIS